MPDTEHPTQASVRVHASANTPGLGHCPPEWLQPVAGDAAQPCGANLEYDSDHAVLLALLEPKVQVQYGAFTAEPDPPDWGAIERQARALSQRSRDLNVLCALTRARTRRAGALGLREGLAIVHAQLHRWAEHVHPQTHIDGEHDPQVRANALAALGDPQGLLSDIREVAISTSAAAPLSVKDVERALGPPSSAYSSGPDAPSVRAQLRELQQRHDERLLALQHSAELARGIAQWAPLHLQQDAPDLSPLCRLLEHLQNVEQRVPRLQAEAVGHGMGQPMGRAAAQERPHAGAQEWARQRAEEADDPARRWLTASPAPQDARMAIDPVQNVVQQREQIRAVLGQVIAWIEEHEPSSPVSIVLRQAQHLWGKRYAEIIAAVPPELLAQWDVQLSQEN